jgi:dTDP-glucose 4,6-dehydratase
MLVLSYERTYGLAATITRSSNNYGTRQHPEKFIPRMITRLLCGRKIPIYGNGKNVRDWLHVSDNCGAIRMLLFGKHGGTFNVSSGFPLSNLELARKVLRLMGKKEGGLAFVADRAGHDFRYSIDSSKIRALGWKPKIKFEGGLRETIEWYCNSRPAWEHHVV